MGLVLTNNVASLNAQNNLSKTNTALSKSLERLSTGLKVNRGADGPAALVISEQQRGQIAGLRTAIDNTNKAVSMVQTAEGALNEINRLLTKVRSLALDSANTGINDANALAANQAEITNSLNTITSIANTTKFGTKNLLNGQAGVTASVTGTNNASLGQLTAGTAATAGAQTVAITQQGAGSSITALAVGVGSLAAAGSLVISGGGLTSGQNLTVALAAGDNITTAQQKVQTALDNAAAIGGGAGKFVVSVANNRLQIQSNVLGNNPLTVAASAGAGAGSVAVVTGFAVAGQTSSATGSYLVGGTGTGTVGAAGTIDFTGGSLTGTISVALVAADDAAAAATKIATALNTAATAQGFAGTPFSASATAGVITITNTIAGAWALTGVASSAAVAAATGIAVGPGTIGVADERGRALTVTVGGQQAAVGAGSNGLNNQVTFGGANGLAFTVNVSAGRTAAAVAGSNTTVNVSDQALTFQTGANSGETIKLSIDKVSAERLGAGVAGLTSPNLYTDLSTIDVTAGNGTGAQDAIKIIDAAISQVSVIRGRLGAFQANSLESNANNLSATLENTVAAESIIRDTDFASEIAMFTKLQTQVQAGSTVLGNANQLTSLVASLLRG